MRIEQVEETGSTNADLLERPFGAGPAEPVARVALRQNAGRGRRGRVWVSRPEASLTVSIALERRIDALAPPLPGVSLASGVAIADCLRGFGVAPELKWPNDLVLGDGKLGGILVEVRRGAGLERVVVGLGLNLAPDADVIANAAQPVATLFAAPPGTEMRARLTEAIGAALVAAWRDYAAGGLQAFLERWRAMDRLRDRPITVFEADGSRWEGIASGVDADGRLLVRTDGVLRPVLAGEVSVRALS